MSGLFALDLKTLIAVACVVGAIQVAVHVLRRAVDLWFDAVDRRRPELLDEYADDVPNRPYSDRDYTLLADEIGLPGDREHSWPGMAPLLAEQPRFGLRETAVVVGGNPARFDVDGVLNGGFGNPYPADATETSGRHARVDGDDTATGLMPAVTDEALMAEEVGAS